MNDNYSGNYINQYYTNQSPDMLYPDIYRELYPHIRQAAAQMAGIDPQSIEGAVNDILQRSGLDGGEEEAIPAVRYGGYSRYRSGYGYPRYGRHGVLGDLVRILLLRELFGH